MAENDRETTVIIQDEHAKMMLCVLAGGVSGVGLGYAAGGALSKDPLGAVMGAVAGSAVGVVLGSLSLPLAFRQQRATTHPVAIGENLGGAVGGVVCSPLGGAIGWMSGNQSWAKFKLGAALAAVFGILGGSLYGGALGGSIAADSGRRLARRMEHVVEQLRAAWTGAWGAGFALAGRLRRAVRTPRGMHRMYG